MTESPTGAALVAGLCALAARLPRGGAAESILEVAGAGALDLGLRLVAFQRVNEKLVLRYLATSPSRRKALEDAIGRPLVGLSRPLAQLPEAPVYGEHLSLFDGVLEAALERGSRERARIEVSDTGVGVPAGLEDRIFEPFFTTKALGTGLGLAVVRRVMTLHGGEVELSPAEVGAKFVLHLPIVRAGYTARL